MGFGPKGLGVLNIGQYIPLSSGKDSLSPIHSTSMYVLKRGQLEGGHPCRWGLLSCIKPWSDILPGNERKDLTTGGDSPIMGARGEKRMNIEMKRAKAIAGMMKGRVINGGGDIILIEIPCPSDPDLTLILTGGGWAVEHCLTGSIYEPEDIDGAYED